MALEKILINVSGQADLDSTIKKLVELGVVDEKNAKQFQKNNKQTQNELEKTKSSFSGIKDAVNNYVQALPGAQHVQQIQNLTKGLNQQGASAQGASKGMNLLRMAMTSLPIIALVAAIASVVAYFKRTEEGGDRLAKIMRVLGVIVDELVKGVAYLGGIIVDYVVKGFQLWFEGAVKIYDFITGTFFKALEGISSILQDLGMESAAKSVDNFNKTLQQGKKDLEAYASGIIKVGSELADMEDALEEKTIAIKLANDKLTTSIEQSLKALRNRTNSYKENLEIIEQISIAEKERFNNSVSLINDELNIKRKAFIQDSIDKQKAADTFDKFVSGQIDAVQAIARVDGNNTTKTIEGIAEVLHKREESTRQSLVLEERLQNFRDAALDKEKDRLEKIRLAAEKAAQDKLKAEEDRLKELAKLEEEFRERGEKELQQSVVNLKDHYDERLNALKESLLKGEISQEAFNQQSEELLLESLQNQKQILEDYGQDVTAIEGQILDQKLKIQKKEEDAFKKSEDEKTKASDKANADRQKAQQIYTDFVISSINKIAEAQVASSQAKTDNEIHNLQLQTESQLKAIDERAKAGLISDEAAAVQKEALQKKQAQKELLLRQKQAQQEKNLALFQIAINTASAVLKAFAQFGPPPSPAGTAAAATAILTGGIEAAIVQARPLPQFKKGGFTGEGNPNDTAGIVHKSEFVMPADKTSKYRNELEAMYNGNYREPIKLQRSLTDIRSDNMAENIYRSMMVNGQFNDKNIVNAISKNGKVKLSNSGELADKIAGKIADRTAERGLFS